MAEDGVYIRVTPETYQNWKKMGILPLLNKCCCGCKLRTGSEFCGWWGALFGTLAALFTTLGVYRISYLDVSDDMDVLVFHLFMFAAIMSLLRIFFSINLLIGIYQRKENNRLPWLIICNAVYSVVYIFLLMILITKKIPGIILLGIFIVICIEFYFILVMNSDYWQRKEDGLNEIIQLV